MSYVSTWRPYPSNVVSFHLNAQHTLFQQDSLEIDFTAA